MPFIKGESGNPAGRPPGSRNTKALLRQAMLDAEGDDLTRQLIAMAQEGDRTALRLCVERVLPRGAGRMIAFELPRVDSAAGARQAVADIAGAMSRAELAPRDAHEMLRVINLGAKIIATAEMAEAAAREGQPRHVEVTWVDPKEKKEKWKSYWKRRYRDSYEAAYGPLPELPDPEEDGMLPPRETSQKDPAAAADKAPPDRGAPPSPPSSPPPPAATAGAGAGNSGNNENNGNNENTGEPRKRPLRRPDPPERFRSAWMVRAAGGVLPALIPILRGWRLVAARLRQASGPVATGGAPLVVAPA
jgi:hypothetical protein